MDLLLLNTNHFKEELENRGHRVLTAAPPKLHHLKRRNLFFKPHRYDFSFEEGEAVDSLIDRLPPDFNLHAILYYDDSSPILYVNGMEHSPVPTIFYSIDAHIHKTWHPMCAGLFDKILVAMKDYVPSFQAYNENVEWFPLWAPLIIEPVEEKNIDVCFRGSLDLETRERRARFFERLKKLVDVDAQGGPYQEPYTRAKILLNEVLEGDVNCKVFESMMCGGLLLNPRSGNGLLDLFQDRVHLVTYEDNNAEDCAEKIRYYLTHDEERMRIARAGREEILRRHTADIRAAELELQLQNLRVSRRKSASFSAAFLDYLSYQVRKHHWSRLLNTRFSSCYGHMLEYASSGLPLSDASIYLALGCKEVLESTNALEASGGLLQKLCMAYPDQPALEILRLDALVKMGKAEEIDALLEGKPLDREELFRQLPQLVKNLEAASYLSSDAFSKYLVPMG